MPQVLLKSDWNSQAHGVEVHPVNGPSIGPRRLPDSQHEAPALESSRMYFSPFYYHGKGWNCRLSPSQRRPERVPNACRYIVEPPRGKLKSIYPYSFLLVVRGNATISTNGTYSPVFLPYRRQTNAEMVPFFLAGLCHPSTGVKTLTVKALVALGQEQPQNRGERCRALVQPPLLPALVARLGDGHTGVAQVRDIE